MPRIEPLYERPLRRPFDESTRQALNAEYHRRRHEIPLHTELHWHATRPRFTITSKLFSVVGDFTPERLVVVAELTLAARLVATEQHRQLAARFIASIADAAGL